jgi:hypothetical protein
VFGPAKLSALRSEDDRAVLVEFVIIEGWSGVRRESG